MGNRSLYNEKDHFKTLQYLKRGLLTLCLTTMVAGFISFGALGYQGWKLFHNPFLPAARQAQAPSPEAAIWAADVYRQEKREHLFHTGLIEACLVALSAASWFGYRRLDKRLNEEHRAKQLELQQAKGESAVADSLKS
jgi:hypothetical protein